MNTEKLSKRLNQVAEYIIEYGHPPIRLADIGSDHAYLPCYLLKHKQIEFAVAGEIVDGPYLTAVKQVKDNHFQDQITVRLGDGFEAVKKEDNINVASICGMGGGLIVSILEAGHRANKLPKLLALQPNTAVAKVRKWLYDHNYHLLNECFIEERGQYYEVLMAQLQANPAQYSEQEIMFGPIHLQIQGPIFQSYWENELNHHRYILEQLLNGVSIEKMAEDRKAKAEVILGEINKIEEVLLHEEIEI